jgi:protein-tyrosine-phosphatase
MTDKQGQKRKKQSTEPHSQMPRDQTVLFVCAGNTCRSPMAAAIFASLVQAHPRLQHVQARSAGTVAREGAHGSPAAVRALKELGLDISDHRAAPLSPNSVRDDDLVLTMNVELAYAARGCLGIGVPIYTLTEYVGATEDLPDLFIESTAVCREIAERLRDLIARALFRLERRGNE